MGYFKIKVPILCWLGKGPDIANIIFQKYMQNLKKFVLVYKEKNIVVIRKMCYDIYTMCKLKRGEYGNKR